MDQYDGLFDDYDEADEFTQAIGYPMLMERAAQAVGGLPDGFIAAGFSNGGGMAEFVATRRPVAGVRLLSGALALDMIGVDAWPAGVPAQIHYTTGDPFRNQALLTDPWVTFGREALGRGRRAILPVRNDPRMRQESRFFDQQPSGRFNSRHEAKLAFFDYLETFYNPAGGTPPSARSARSIREVLRREPCGVTMSAATRCPQGPGQLQPTTSTRCGRAGKASSGPTNTQPW